MTTIRLDQAIKDPVLLLSIATAFLAVLKDIMGSTFNLVHAAIHHTINIRKKNTIFQGLPTTTKNSKCRIQNTLTQKNTRHI
jgi:hypothetical protein